MLGCPVVFITMSEKLEGSGLKNWLLWPSLYATVLLAFIGYLNYAEPYSPDPVTTPVLLQLILWGALYVPVVALPIAARWQVTDFGITLNPLLALALLLVTPLCAGVTIAAKTTWGSAILEAYARTGEEVFFRGFIFALFARLFVGKRRPWLWAAIGSSTLFALAHTQTFQQSFLSQYGSASVPVIYRVIERLLNIWAIALLFALLRAWTRSVLPGAVAHSILQGSILTVPFVLIIYGLALFWAHRRGEQVAFAVSAQTE